jgi:hypothetical protein
MVLPTMNLPSFRSGTAYPAQVKEEPTGAIRHSLGDQREEFLVFHGPEKISEIRIDDPLGPALYLYSTLCARRPSATALVDTIRTLPRCCLC